MFGKSKGQKPRKRQTDGDNNKPKPSLAQMGFLDIPNVSDLALGNIGDDDDDDSDLEAELLALTSGKGSNGPKRAKKVVAPENLDKMVAECMKDSDNDDQDFDEEDPDLLAELSALGPEEEDEYLQNEETASPEASLASPDLKPEKPTPIIIRPSPFVAGTSVVNLLKERIEMYKEAEQNAVETGEKSRAKRFNRGLKTLNQMLKDVNAGKSINEEDIPPTVLRHSSRNSSVSDLANLPESTSEPKPENQNQKETSSIPSSLPQNIAFTENVKPNEEPSSSSPLSIILKHQLEYKKAALAAKKKGSTEEALRLMKTAKQFEPLIQAAKEGQNVDIDSLPPPPSSDEGNVHKNEINSTPRSIEENKIQKNDNETVSQPQPQVPVQATPPTPTSVVEALEQRLAKYTEQRDKAKAEGNARKERMNDRIIKQYQQAIRTHKLGQHFDFSELPTPPGFPPIPIGGASQGPTNVNSPASSDSTALPQYSKPSSEDPQPKPDSQLSPDAPSGPAQAPKSAPASKLAPSNVKRPAPSAPPRVNVRKNPQSMVERQLSVLKRRREQFKVSALEAKKKGEIEQAKEYIRNYKGIEQLIGATEGGLPVDMNTVPIPPQEKLGCENVSMDFEVIDKDDCVVGPTSDADMALTYSKLEEDLIAQIKMCAHTREHFKALGDVASSNRFEQLILHTKKDLDAVRAAFKRGDTPPRFHYENRTFTLIQCNTDLNDTDCEVCIVRGINFNVPNPTDVDTYVKIEFPYPSDAPPQERTNVIKDSNNPEFNHKVVFSIDRKARALSRVFKRHSVKCQVIAKGGWFHRDSVFGNVKIPLVALENKCTLHDSFDLIDDKKKMVGGKIEVKIRVRNPILTKQLEKVTEKWIIIDGF